MHTHTQMDLIYRQERLSTLHQEARRCRMTSSKTPVHRVLWSLWSWLTPRQVARN